jgi:hypothetical protein
MEARRQKADGGKARKGTAAWLLGLGLDNKDGHVRITRGPNFQLVGGSQPTHEQMQETAIKVNEELVKRGKRLADIGPQEFLDILRKTQ